MKISAAAGRERLRPRIAAPICELHAMRCKAFFLDVGQGCGRQWAAVGVKRSLLRFESIHNLGLQVVWLTMRKSYVFVWF